MLDTLKAALEELAETRGLLEEAIDVQCAPLSAEEAIGHPEHQDYPIQRGREVMMQAVLRGVGGQAFTRETITRRFTLGEVLALPLESDWQRAVLVAAANAAFAYAGRADRTIHCRDQGPVECARRLGELTQGERVALFGLQPRFLEQLAALGEVRCVDVDPGLVGERRAGILIEPWSAADEVIAWADRVLVTGSALVNDTFSRFVGLEKPVHVFGTTGAAAAVVLGLPRYCNTEARLLP